jgi:hypothetical protein
MAWYRDSFTFYLFLGPICPIHHLLNDAVNCVECGRNISDERIGKDVERSGCYYSGQPEETTK